METKAVIGIKGTVTHTSQEGGCLVIFVNWTMFRSCFAWVQT